MFVRLIVILSCFILYGPEAVAQIKKFNVNINNGLPANHVYTTITDRYGYLWIATEKGVLRYDGYNFKNYNLSSGLPTDDVWNLHEDRKGRIWVLNIASDIGYIYNGKYQRTIQYPVLDAYNIINPRDFIETPRGLAFVNYDPNKHVFYTNDDTLRNVAVNILKPYPTHLRNNGEIIGYKDNALYQLVFSAGTVGMMPIYRNYKHVPSHLCEQYLIPYPYTADSGMEVPVFDVENRRYKPFYIEAGEKIVMINHPDEYIYITTNKHIYTFSKNMTLLSVTANVELLGGHQGNVITIRRDSFWTQCISTDKAGLLIDYRTGAIQHNRNLGIDDFVFIGKDANVNNVSWNARQNKICILYRNGTTQIYPFRESDKIVRLIPFDSNRSLLFTRHGTYWLYANGRIETFEAIRNGDSYETRKNKAEFEEAIARAATDACFTSVSDLYVFSYSYGFAHVQFTDTSFRVKKLVDTRLPNMLHLEQLGIIIAYDDSRVLVFNYRTGNKYLISARSLNSLGIKRIYGMCADRNGNIFCNTNDRFFYYNLYTGRQQTLLTNYRLHNAAMSINGHNLIVCAKAGIIVSKIIGRGNIGKPALYANPKELLYKHFYGLMASDSNILVSTDSGIYKMRSTMPAADGKAPFVYSLLANVNGTTQKVRSGDTVFVNSEESAITFSIISPSGVGQPVYQKQLQGYDYDFTELINGSYQISSLKREAYYILNVRVLDDAWSMNDIKLTIYLQPQWWQSRNGRWLLWFMGVVFTSILVATAIYITQRNVKSKHLKKNLHLELKNLKLALELKSLYAQINPHFIFNTLTTGLYYIKKKQSEKAYDHISSFSDLLRSFIKSSRNRYIPISEEVVNLENYLRLQLARFEGKFTFDITINGGIENEMIPSLLLQPIVENAINHGLFHKEGPGRILVTFARGKDVNTIVCTVDDDGIGRQKANDLRSRSNVVPESYGTELTKSLIDIFNTYEATKISLNYIDKQYPFTGTKVEITIIKQA